MLLGQPPVDEDGTRWHRITPSSCRSIRDRRRDPNTVHMPQRGADRRRAPQCCFHDGAAGSRLDGLRSELSRRAFAAIGRLLRTRPGQAADPHLSKARLASTSTTWISTCRRTEASVRVRRGPHQRTGEDRSLGPSSTGRWKGSNSDRRRQYLRPPPFCSTRRKRLRERGRGARQRGKPR